MASKSGGYSRRDLLKRGAVTTAGAWVAPLIIESVMAPAVAGTLDCTCSAGCTTKLFGLSAQCKQSNITCLTTAKPTCLQCATGVTNGQACSSGSGTQSVTLCPGVTVTHPGSCALTITTSGTCGKVQAVSAVCGTTCTDLSSKIATPSFSIDFKNDISCCGNCGSDTTAIQLWLVVCCT